MKIDPEYISNEDIDWQRQSQRTYAKLSLKISQTKTRTKRTKKRTRTKTTKRQGQGQSKSTCENRAWRYLKAVTESSTIDVSDASISSESANPLLWDKYSTLNVFQKCKHRLYCWTSTSISFQNLYKTFFCNCSLKMVKKTSWSFHWHQTSWMKLLVLKHAELSAVSFYIAILGKILPVVDGKDWQVCGNDGSISVNLRINMIKSWKNAASFVLFWS